MPRDFADPTVPLGDLLVALTDELHMICLDRAMNADFQERRITRLVLYLQSYEVRKEQWNGYQKPQPSSMDMLY
jgi:hypothetical protein